VAATLPGSVSDALATIRRLQEAGVSLDDVTDKLLVDGLASFQKSFDGLVAGLAKKAATLSGQFQASR
jgi:hypothetical protein